MTKLNKKDITKLKENGLLQENEIAILEGDTILAENILTKVRRVIDASSVLLEGTKKLLLD